MRVCQLPMKDKEGTKTSLQLGQANQICSQKENNIFNVRIKSSDGFAESNGVKILQVDI